MTARPREFLFVDPDVRDARILLDGLIRPVTVVRLKRHRDPLRQIAVALAGSRDIEALHFLCHGAPGALRLAGRMVGTEALRVSEGLLSVIRAALSGDAAIGLYACSVCVGEAGATFVDTLSHALDVRVEGASERLGPGAGWQSFDPAFLPFDPRRIESYPHVLVDTVTGTAGDDTYPLAFSSAPRVLDFTQGGNDTIYASGNQNDTVYAGPGNDRITGSSFGSYHFDGGAGDDHIIGSVGNDWIEGGSGADTLSGSQGDDTIVGLGADTIFAGEGNDLIILRGDASAAYIFNAGLGDDTVRFEGTVRGPGSVGSAQHVEIADGADVTMTVTLLNGIASKLTADGTETVRLEGSGTLSTLNNVIDTIATLDDDVAQTLTLSAAEAAGTTLVVGDADLDGFNVTGSADDQAVTGSTGQDTLNGGEGADTLFGGAGNDVFTGSAAELDGDTIDDLQAGDRIVLTGVGGLGADDVRLSGDGTTLEIDTDGSGFSPPEVTLTLGNGAGAGMAVDSVTDDGNGGIVVGFVEVTNTAPVLSGLDGGVTFTEGGGAVVVDANVGVADSDSADFDTGTLTVAVTGNAVPGEDVLGIFHQGIDIGQIGVSGSDVTYDSAVIGTVTGGSSGIDLVVTFGGNATPTAVQALARAVTYVNGNTGAPTIGQRTLTFTLTDGDGGSASGIATVGVAGVNDAPALDAGASPVLAAIDEDVNTGVDNPGTAVADLVVDGSITDADGGAVEAIAVTAVNNANGVWQFSTDNGSTWSDFSGTTGQSVDLSSSARLLDGTMTGSDTHRVRFVPDPDVNGSSSITFRAWDNSAGSAGGTADTTTNGGNSAFSSTSDTASISIDAVDDTPTVTSGSTASVAENASGAAYTVAGSDPDAGASLSYAISGGADASLFDIDAGTGAVTFKAAPDFEAPADTGGDNVYDIEVTADDGTNTSTARAVAITVTAVDETPSVTSGATASVTENTGGTAYTVTGSDPDAGASLSYAISGGADASLFDIDAITGAVTFKAAPDFEAPADTGGDNVYDIEVTADDGTNTSATQAVAITVTDANEAPSITSGATASVAENIGGTVYTVAASDPDAGASVSYAISGGADTSLFNIDASTGAVTFKAAPDFEAPADTGGDNVYDIEVTADDGTNTSATQAVAITVTDVDEDPAFSSGTTANAVENGTATGYTAAATDPEGGGVTYSISGGADAAAFGIDASTGALTFTAPQDFETPSDADGDGDYAVQVTATDTGSNAVSQAVTISLTDVNETPTVTSGGTASFAENGTGTVYTVTGSDPDAGANLTYAISGGADASLFDIDADSGTVTFKTAPDFEAPADSDADNTYDIEVTAGDGTNTSAAEAVTISVTDETTATPAFTSAASASVAENQTAAHSASAINPESGAAPSYSIADGADAALFAIDGTSGAVTFKIAPDFEAPADVGGDNVYDLTVRASVGGKDADQAVAITVTAADETPSVTSGATASVAENAAGTVYTVNGSDPDAGASLTYALSGGTDAGLFDIDADSGAVTFKDVPDFEAPADADTDNAYNIEVTANDGTNTSSARAVTISVTDADEPPSVASGTTASFAENGTGTAYTVTGTDPDAGTSLSYAISGGADAGLFDIDTATGAVTFKDAPDFEAPADDGGDNVYDIQVTAGDGINTSPAQDVSITVTGVDEAPSVTSVATASVAENTAGTAYTVAGTDPDAGTTLGYAISGGADAGLFDIDAATGAVTFKTAPDFEVPADADTDNAYEIEVTADDGTSTSSAQAVTVSVTDLNEAPVIGSLDGDTLTYDRSGNPNRLDTAMAATLTDDSSDFDGGNLTVVITAGGEPAEDILTFDTADVTLSGITAGSAVTVGETVIGTLGNAIAAGNDLVVDFDSNADADAVQTLLRSIAYQNIDTASPTQGTRTIQVSVNDGGLSSSVDLTAAIPAPPPSGDSDGGGGSSGGIVVTPTAPTTAVGGSTSSTAQVISNTGTVPGNARIVQNTNNNGNVVTATLPTSTAITSEGPSVAQTGEEALTTLVNAVVARNSSAEADLVTGARVFLNNLASTTTLDVRTIVPTTTQSSLSEPIVITGTTPSDGNSQSEAFVIDLRQLPSGSTLQLDNIEFASVMGSATVTGGAGDNYVTGDDMSQFISLGVGDDTLFGGDGADTIGSGAGADDLHGDAGDDKVFGGLDTDTVWGGSDQDVVYGNQQDDVLYGNQGLDILYGGQDADVAYGGQHADIVYGNLGDDVLYGNLGADTLFGGQGGDILFGGQDNDLLISGVGDDTLNGNRGADTISTGEGADLIVVQADSGIDIVADFDGAAGDRVQIAANVNGTSIDSFTELVGVATSYADGSVTLALGGSNTLILMGVNTTELQSDWFLFN